MRLTEAFCHSKLQRFSHLCWLQHWHYKLEAWPWNFISTTIPLVRSPHTADGTPRPWEGKFLSKATAVAAVVSRWARRTGVSITLLHSRLQAGLVWTCFLALCHTQPVYETTVGKWIRSFNGFLGCASQLSSFHGTFGLNTHCIVFQSCILVSCLNVLL